MRQYHVGIAGRRRCGRQNDERLLAQHLPLAGLWDGERWMAGDGRVDIPIEKFAIHLRRVAAEDANLDLRIDRCKATEDVCQQPWQRGLDGTEPQLTREHTARRDRFEVVHLPQNSACAIQDCCCSLGRPYGAARAKEETGSDLALEGTNSLGDAR